MNNPSNPARHPLVWVPSLYFAQGLPWAVVAALASTMYTKMGVSNSEITHWLSLLGWAWVLKPLWSPFLEIFSSKKLVIVLFQAISGLSILAAAFCLQRPDFFMITIAFLAVTSYSSATHDIASDGLYIESLSKSYQSIYAGWQGAFWNGAKLFAKGALVMLAGYLESKFNTAQVWTIVMMVPGILLLVLAAYHMWSLPSPKRDAQQAVSLSTVGHTTWDVLLTFFQKPGIWMAVLFIILFRAGEGQVQTIGSIFLIAEKAKGGLGLTTLEMGTAYGIFSTIAFLVGSILGGYFANWRGLKKSMFIMILAMNVPNLTFWYLSAYMPTDIYLITAVLSLEQLGYGFGYVGVILYIMQVVAPGKYPTAHYALGTGVMALGFVLFQQFSGDIQEWLGYSHFFIWCVISAVPVLIMSLVVKIDDNVGDDTLEETAGLSALPEVV